MKTTALIVPGQVPRTKLFYRIQEVARMTGLKPYVLRYWESEFKELAPGKDRSDQRRYRPEDVEVVLAIRKLLYEDRFTIEGARKRLGVALRAGRDQKSAEVVEASFFAPEPVSAPAPRAAMRRPVMADSASVKTAAPAAAPIGRELRQLRTEVNALLELLSA